MSPKIKDGGKTSKRRQPVSELGASENPISVGPAEKHFLSCELNRASEVGFDVNRYVTIGGGC